MKYPVDLQPSTTAALTLLSGRVVSIPKATPTFRPWQGPPIANTFGGKLLLNSMESPCFAEVVIHDHFIQAGWSGRRVEPFGAPAMRPRFLTSWSEDGLKAAATEAIVEPRIAALLDGIAQENGSSYSGCWDVVAWKAEQVVFAEAKQSGRDQIQPSQLRWLEAALKRGLPEETFLIVEWCVS